ncbi:MAG: hypothetical protein ACE5GW_07735 [Planctomycetota bacterium]
MGAPLAIVTAVVVGILGAGCAGRQNVALRSLPFHVAVIPVEVEEGIRVLEGEEQQGDFRVRLTGPEVTAALVDKLSRSCFTKATWLEYPEEMEPEEFKRQPEEEQDQHWIREAEKIHADLVLECALHYSPEIRSHTTEKFWLNLPLFLIGGPLTFFVNDREYRAPADLSATIYDLNPAYARKRAMRERGSRLLTLSSEFRSVSLDFQERAGKNVGSYLAALVVPSGLLATDSDRAKVRVKEELLRTVCRELAVRIGEKADELLFARRIASFFVNPEELRVERSQGDQIDISGAVVLRRTEGVERLYEYRITAGDDTVLRTFGEGVPDVERSVGGESYYRYQIHEMLPLPASVDSLQVRIWEVSRGINSRSYTFPVRPAHQRSRAMPTAPEPAE